MAFRDWLRALRRDRRPVERTPRKRRPLYLESLEERVLLDGALVLGRTLSAYTTAGLQNNELSITYTAYNQQAEPLTGVLLTTTLQPGLSIKSASQLPDQNGQELAWSLGDLDPSAAPA
jgi:hypothetical protein